MSTTKNLRPRFDVNTTKHGMQNRYTIPPHMSIRSICHWPSPSTRVQESGWAVMFVLLSHNLKYSLANVDMGLNVSQSSAWLMVTMENKNSINHRRLYTWYPFTLDEANDLGSTKSPESNPSPDNNLSIVPKLVRLRLPPQLWKNSACLMSSSSSNTQETDKGMEENLQSLCMFTFHEIMVDTFHFM